MKEESNKIPKKHVRQQSEKIFSDLEVKSAPEELRLSPIVFTRESAYTVQNSENTLKYHFFEYPAIKIKSKEVIMFKQTLFLTVLTVLTLMASMAYSDTIAEMHKKTAIYGSAIDQKIAFYQSRLYLLDSEYTILSEIGRDASAKITYLTQNRGKIITEMIACNAPLHCCKIKAEMIACNAPLHCCKIKAFIGGCLHRNAVVAAF